MITANITKESSEGGYIGIDFDKHGRVNIMAKDYPSFTLDEIVELKNEIEKTVLFLIGHA